MKKPLILLMLLPVIQSCVTEVAEDSPELGNLNKHHGFLISSKDEVSEICPDLQAGQKLFFKIEANLKISFNVHYHQNEQVVYPVVEQPILRLEKTLEAETTNSYCLMWKGQFENTEVNYSYSIQ